jgi:hypothetical protein
MFSKLEKFLEKVKERDDMMEQKKRRIGTKKVEQDRKSELRFTKALEKYRLGATLSREDLVALINRTKHQDDGANGKKFKRACNAVGPS